MLIKKCLLAGMLTLLSSSLVHAQDPAVHPLSGEPLVIDCLRGTPDAIDGDLSDWNLEAMTPAVLDVAEQLNSGQASWDGPADLSAEFYLLWDDENVYIAVIVKDDALSMNKTGGTIWNSDAIEIFFSTLNHVGGHAEHYQYGFNANAQTWLWDDMEGGGQSAVPYLQIGASLTADGYICEAAIPHAEITPLDWTVGGIIGFHPVLDDTEAADREIQMTWTSREAHDQSLGFGHLILSDKRAIAAELPKDPSPEDEAVDVPIDTTLSWTPGDFALAHDVYMGTSFDDVNNATTPDSPGQSESTFEPGRLAYGQTYYWRVDEVNGAPDNTVFKGSVWSFEAEPLAIPIKNITATASGSFGISSPENTIDGSELVDDLHGTGAAAMWISTGIPATIEYAFDTAYTLHELWIWNSNQLIESFVGFGAKDVVIEYSLDGENWTVLEGVGPLAQAPGTEGYAHNNTINFGGAMAQHVRMTINSVQGIAPQASLSEVRFYSIPVNAREPWPADGGSADSVNTTLSWRSGRGADGHEVVLSTDQAAVADGSAGVVVLQESSYTPDTLVYSETYYWQVTETNAVSTPPRYEGPIWSFMAPEYLTLDDFELYADEPFLEIWDTWVDGFDDPGNGAIVGNVNEAEKSIVHEGRQSMPIHYDNSAAPISVATRTFDPVLDWTVGAPTILSLHVRGDAANDGQPIFAVITDRSGQSATVSYQGGDPTASLSTVFEPWIIALADLAPVSLGSIESVSIGVGTPGGAPSSAAGTVYVDLLRLGTPLP